MELTDDEHRRLDSPQASQRHRLTATILLVAGDGVSLDHFEGRTQTSGSRAGWQAGTEAVASAVTRESTPLFLDMEVTSALLYRFCDLQWAVNLPLASRTFPRLTLRSMREDGTVAKTRTVVQASSGNVDDFELPAGSPVEIVVDHVGVALGHLHWSADDPEPSDGGTADDLVDASGVVVHAA